MIGIRGLMLDVDGVVLRVLHDAGNDWSATLEADLGISPARLQAVFFTPHWRRIVTGHTDLMAVLDQVMSRLSATVTAAQLVEYWFTRDAQVDTALLEQLAGYRDRGLRVWFATNQEHLRADWLMHHLGLGRYAEAMLYSAQLGAAKPDAAFFDRAAARTGLARRELLLIDDQRANVSAARANGWHAALWTGAETLDTLLTRVGVDH